MHIVIVRFWSRKSFRYQITNQLNNNYIAVFLRKMHYNVGVCGGCCNNNREC